MKEAFVGVCIAYIVVKAILLGLWVRSLVALSWNEHELISDDPEKKS